MRTVSKNLMLLLCMLSAAFHYGQEADTYSINYAEEAPGVIHVKARIYASDSLLYMSRNSSKSERFPVFVHGLKVTDNTGRAIATAFQESGHWVMKDVKPGTPIALEYELHIDHEKEEWPGGIDGVAYKRDYGIMTSGRTLFVMNGEEKRDIQVRAKLPETWKISTPWKSIEGSVNSFVVPNMFQLQESFLFAGTHEELRMEREGFTLKFVLGGDKLIADKDRITSLSNALLDYYIKMMGGNPVPAPGSELDQCLVIITENSRVDGEVIGNHISMFMDPVAAPRDQMIGWFIFAHEFFHFWNGKTLRFQGTTSDWFKEGISNYYTMKGLYQVGFLNEEAFKGVINGLFYQKYINDPGLGEKSPVASASGFSKDQHWGLIYGGGLFSGIAMDMEIRSHTKNEKSLDDIMRALYQEYGGSEEEITNQVLIEKVSSYGYDEFEKYYKKHLEGSEVIHLQPYLKNAGMIVSEDGGQLQLTPVADPSALQQEIWQGALGELE